MEYFDAPVRLFYQPEFLKKTLEKIVSPYPVMLQLSPTNACDLNCYWCSDRNIRNLSTNMMDINVITTKLSEFAKVGVKAVTIEGGGEPTLYPHLDDLIESCKINGMDVGLITNGMNRISAGALGNLSWVRISLDAGDKEEFKSIKGIDGYDRVISTLLDYALLKPNNLQLGVSYIITKFGSQNIEPLVSRLSKIPGVNYIQIKPVTDQSTNVPNPGAIYGYLRSYETDTFKVHFPVCESGNSAVPCHAHTLTSVITAPGDVLFCKRLYANQGINVKDLVLGNINLHSLKEIYEGEKATHMMGRVRDVDYVMHLCPTCRLTKYNKFIDDLMNNEPVSRNFI